MNSRICTPFYIFFLNPDYVAARSLRSLRSKNTCLNIVMQNAVLTLLASMPILSSSKSEGIFAFMSVIYTWLLQFGYAS